MDQCSQQYLESVFSPVHLLEPK